MQQTQVNKTTMQIQPIQAERKHGFYEKYIKRLLDIICSLVAIIVFCWLYIIVAVLVRAKLGSPILFKQPRSGKIDPKTGYEKIFYMYKFRTMTDERDENGELLPDGARLTSFGKSLRSMSLDEIPEVFNILKGDMSVVGPRPLLVKYLPWYTEEQRKRHTVRPGLTGYAQAHGRNHVNWDDRFQMDVEYAEKVTFCGDVKIIFETIKTVFKHEGISSETSATMDDFIDYCGSVGRQPRC